MEILEIVRETIADTWLMFPLLYITYCVLEVFERRPQNDDRMFFALQDYGPLFGSILGLIPQCGFSILAAMLFLQNNITLGTLIAVMIATSDEAIPILISNPTLLPTLGKLLLCKFLIGTLVGFAVDKLLFTKQKIDRFDEMEDEEEGEESEDEEAADNSCPCCYTQYPLYVSAFLRSLKIFAFLFITSFVLTAGIGILGEEKLGILLLSDSVFQPFIAAALGFIPNCAITVVLAELFAYGSLQFGSLLAGLITNAGMGLLCLIRYGGKKKDIINTVVILYVAAVIFGIIL